MYKFLYHRSLELKAFHFFQVFHEHNLLAPVQQHQGIDAGYNDNTGNVTSEGLEPTEGIKSIDYIIEQVPINKNRRKRQALSPVTLPQVNLRNKEVFSLITTYLYQLLNICLLLHVYCICYSLPL